MTVICLFLYRVSNSLDTELIAAGCRSVWLVLRLIANYLFQAPHPHPQHTAILSVKGTTWYWQSIHSGYSAVDWVLDNDGRCKQDRDINQSHTVRTRVLITVQVSSTERLLDVMWITTCIRLITVAAWPKPWTVFACSDTGIVGSNPTRGVDVCVRLFCM
jgi:hypothetical protein